MQRGDHPADAELPLEVEPDVSSNREQCENRRNYPGADQLAADAGADDLDPAIVDPRTERLARQLDRLLLRRVSAGLARQTDQHIGRWAEPLQRGLADVQRVEF